MDTDSGLSNGLREFLQIHFSYCFLFVYERYLMLNTLFW